MAYQLIFHPKAEAEYLKVYRWYEKVQVGLGNRFEQMVELKLSKITARPYSFKVVKGLYRQAAVAVFPYVIVYQISTDQTYVYIVAVFHTKRNPKIKFRKQPD